MVWLVVLVLCVGMMVGVGTVPMVDRFSGRSWLRQRTARSVVVHVSDGPDGRSIEGLLVSVGQDGVVLRAARYLTDDAQVPLLGELFVPRDRVLFVQVTEPKTV